jgi:hypothetical protein
LSPDWLVTGGNRIRSKLVMVLMVAAAAGLWATPILAQSRLICISNKDVKGELTVEECLAQGERFAVVDQDGLVRILSPEEVELTKAFNPKILQTRAFGMNYQRMAPSYQLEKNH